MRNATYKELFDESLEREILNGGQLSTVITAVIAYRGDDQACRSFLFQDWVRNTQFNCSLCGESVYQDTRHVEEDDRVLCRKCKKS